MEHDRVNISSTNISCGVMALSRISDDTEGALYAIASRLYHPSRGDPCAQFVLSDLYGQESKDVTSTDKLCTTVLLMNLGEITETLPTENPKTGHIIVTYIWTVNHTIFKAWYANERVRRLSKVGA